MSSADVSVAEAMTHSGLNTNGVADFYKNRNVLITGGTGFLGKALIEKLLRSCEDIGTIYVLIRRKKGKNTEERLQGLLSLPIFDRLHNERPEARNKVVAIEGDLSQPSVELNERDEKLLKEVVSVVFHSAATVKFDEELKVAVNMNVRGTKNVIDLARNMKNLKAFIYVSTAYSNSDRRRVEEKFYPPKAPMNFWHDLIVAAEKNDERELNAVTPAIIGNLPNTYTFTKQITESLVYDHKDVIPTVIYRPSIVTFALNEPGAGWVDNLNGLTGLMMGYYMGVIRVILGTWGVRQDYAPVDYVVNGMVAAASERSRASPGECTIYNCTSGKYSSRLDELFSIVQEASRENPTRNMMWKPNLTLTDSMPLYRLCFFLFHLVPALLIDAGLKASRINFSLIKAYRKVFIATKALSFFILTTIDFENKNMLDLYGKLNKKDKETFNFDLGNIANHKKEITAIGIQGLKKYMFKEDTSQEAVEKLKQRRKYYDWADTALKSLGLAFLLNCIWKYYFQHIC